jgi:hypothetical protein
MIIVDVPYIFDTVGGPGALWKLLKRHNPGRPLHYATVQMWKSRRAISAAWLAATLHAMTREGYDLGHLLTDDDPLGPKTIPWPDDLKVNLEPWA